ncbi:MAG: PAS domain S-box protein, partial [Candidatus Omnitrophota bacterium]
MGRMITKEQIEALKPYILENAPAIIAVHDLDHNILWANKAYRDATGLSLKRVEGKKCYHAWGLDRFCKGCPVSKAMRTDKKQEAELTPQNQKHWPADQGSWLAKATPIKDEQGQIIGAIEIAHDITATMDAVEALRKTELRYQDLYDNAPDMFVSVDAKTSKILECNRTFLKKTGYKKKEIIGEQIFSVYHPDSLEGAHKAFKSFVTTGKVSDAELQLKKKNGSKIDVSLNVSAVRDKKNRILQSRSVWRDITELKKAEKKISDLAKFPEENPDPVFRVSKDGKVLYSNVAGVKMILTGWGSKIGEFVPERWRRFAKDALTNKKRIVEEESFEDKTFLFTITPVSEEHYVNIYARDITKLKEIEKVKYNIMRDVSHSIKTPLAVSRMANE